MKQLLFVTLLLASFVVNSASFQGTSSGVFVNPTGPSGMVTTGTGTSEFTWGTPFSSTDHSSSLGYAGSTFDVDENDSFVFGSLNYFNGTVFIDTIANTVDLSAILNFTAPFATVENFVFNLGLITTTNTSDPEESADFVNFDNSVSTNHFTNNGIDFTLEFLGFGTLQGGGFTVEDSFRVLENDSATVDLVGRITSTPGTNTVPEPTTFALLGLGFAGIKLAKKNKKAKC